MFWIAVDKDGEGHLFARNKPRRYADEYWLPIYASDQTDTVSQEKVKELTGKDLTWDDEPVEIIRELKPFPKDALPFHVLFADDPRVREWMKEAGCKWDDGSDITTHMRPCDICESYKVLNVYQSLSVTIPPEPIQLGRFIGVVNPYVNILDA